MFEFWDVIVYNYIDKMKISLVIILAGTIAVMSVSQKAYSADIVKSNAAVMEASRMAVHNVEAEIDADRNKIIEEGGAIKADRRKLKEAEKMPDKLKVEEIKKEINQDIGNREAAIRDLKKGISNKKEQRYILMNGKQKDEPRRTRQDAK